MAGEDLLINAALDALGWSANARQHQRNLAEQTYAGAYKGLQQGMSLKDQGIDPKFIESQLGPDYAAHLVGYEKSDAFKSAAQALQTNHGLYDAATAYLSAPVYDNPALAAAAAQPGTPSFEGGRAPAVGDYATRLAQLSPEVRALVYPESQAANIAERGAAVNEGNLAYRTGPAYQLDLGQLGVSQQNAATAARNAGTAEAELGLRNQEFQTGVRERTANRILSATELVMRANPTMTPAQARLVAKYHAGIVTERRLKNQKTANGTPLLDVPGVATGRGGVPPAALYKAVNDQIDAPTKFYTKPENRKSVRSWSPQEFDAYNTQHAVQLTQRMLKYAINAGDASDPQKIVDDVLSQTQVLTPEGPTPVLSLRNEAQKTVYINAVATTVAQALGIREGGAPGADTSAPTYGQRLAGAAPAPVAPGPVSAPVSAPAPVPTGPTGSLAPGRSVQPGVTLPVTAEPTNLGPLPIPAGMRNSGATLGAPGARKLVKPLRR